MKTKELIRRFEALHLRTEVRANNDNKCFILDVYAGNTPIVSIYDSVRGTCFSLGDEFLHFLVNEQDIEEFIKILYELVINNDDK